MGVARYDGFWRERKLGHARRSSPGRLRHFAATLLPDARFTLNARTGEGARPLGVLFRANSARYNTLKPDMALRESEMSGLGSCGRREIGHQRRSRAAKRANVAGVGAFRGTGAHFAHSVTIFASVIDRFVGPESVQSGRMMFM